MVYPAILPLMRAPRLPVVDRTDAPADLNGHVNFAERRNLVSARVPSHFNWLLLQNQSTLTKFVKHFVIQTKSYEIFKPIRQGNHARWFSEDNRSCKRVVVRFLSVKSVAGPNRPSRRQHQTGLLTLTLVEPNTDEGPWERSLP